MKTWLRIAAWLILLAGAFEAGRELGKRQADRWWQHYDFAARSTHELV